MSLPRALLLALLAFAAAGPSCFTALMWGDSRYGMIGAPRTDGFRSLELGAAAAFGRGDAPASLRLLLPPEVAGQLGAGLPPDAGWLVVSPADEDADAKRFAAQVRQHAAAARDGARDGPWPLRLVLLEEDGRCRWLLVGGERAVQLPPFGSADELHTWLGSEALACATEAPSPAVVGDMQAAPWAGVAVVELVRVESWAGSSDVARAGAKVLLTPVSLALDVVTLPFQLVMLLGMLTD